MQLLPTWESKMDAQKCQDLSGADSTTAPSPGAGHPGVLLSMGLSLVKELAKVLLGSTQPKVFTPI